jgi:multimeric flavodoxin WrbA
MSAIAINGSPSRDSGTAILLPQLENPVYHLGDGVWRAHDAILETETIVFGTPVLWFNVSALMKELIDGLPEGPDSPCEGKTAFFVAVCDEDGGLAPPQQLER